MLAKKIRETRYNDLVGQEKVIKTLKNYSKKKEFPDVMYFVGHSGAGKGTLAFITAMTINCKNPVEEKDGSYSPCNKCDSCQDIIHQRFQRDTFFYSGGQLKSQGIDKITKSLAYTPRYDKTKIFILDEAQMISSLKKFLNIIEEPIPNVKFILCSTDKSKFSNKAKSDNKSQETNALRSRGAYFSIKPLSDTDIGSYLIRLLDKDDPENTLPKTFLSEVLPTIIDNCNGNIRQAINDYEQCIIGELYNKSDVVSLLDYVDEMEYYEAIDLLLNKDKKFFDFFDKENDGQKVYEYTFKVLNNVSVFSITGKASSEWKRQRAISLMNHSNYNNLCNIYEETAKKCLSYFNEKIYINEVCKYMKESKPSRKLEEEGKKINAVESKPVRRRRTR